MDIDRASEKERYDMLAEMADLYFNQGKTQSEIARYFDTNRFRVAKLLQDARAEHIVEIKINYSNERNKVMEKELMELFPLQKAIVVNTQYAPYIDALMQIGRVGANYLSSLLIPDSVIGITWGKTIYSVISQLSAAVRNPVTAVQVTGYYRMMNPSVDSRELVRAVATVYNGSYYYLNTPIYIQGELVKQALCQEPIVKETLEQTKKMDVILSGIGGYSSLPFNNPSIKPYLTKKDLEASKDCIGSLYGFVLDRSGKIANIDLNQKLISADLSDILHVPHQIVVACGRHKTDIIAKALENRLFNELITDNDTAVNLIENHHRKNNNMNP